MYFYMYNQIFLVYKYFRYIYQQLLFFCPFSGKLKQYFVKIMEKSSNFYTKNYYSLFAVRSSNVFNHEHIRWQSWACTSFHRLSIGKYKCFFLVDKSESLRFYQQNGKNFKHSYGEQTISNFPLFLGHASRKVFIKVSI